MCPLLQRNGYAGEARAEFQDAPSPPRTIPELSPCFFVTKRHLTAREGERQGERHRGGRERRGGEGGRGNSDHGYE